MKKIGILTSGGDAPGMNPAVRAVAKIAISYGLEPYMVIDGYKGLVENNFLKASLSEIDGINKLGGTAIGTARLPEFKDIEVRKVAVRNLREKGIEALVVIGGDGSYHGAQKLTEMGINCIGLPGTIDNDITSSDWTIGFDTALQGIVDNIERIKDTMTSHSRCCVVEVMGHGCGDLAVFSALATGAQIVVTNEMKMSKEDIAYRVEKAKMNGDKGIIVIVSEFIFEDLKALSTYITDQTGVTTRPMILGHTQRGGSPTAMERVRAIQMGEHAVKLLMQNIGGRAIGFKQGKVTDFPIMEALEIPRESRKELTDLSNKINNL